MGGIRDGVLGTEAPAHSGPSGNSSIDVFGGGDPPGILGVDQAIPLDESVQRIIVKVTKDWVPPNPRTRPAIVVHGATLEQAAGELNKLREWGDGGGSLVTDDVPVATSKTVTVHLHAHLVRRLPTWTGYAKASKAAKAEWDQMVAKLAIHEDRHVAIAIEEAENLAKALIGHDIDDIADMVTAANGTMQSRQDDMDTDCEHGAKEGVPFGDVILDYSVK